METIPKEILSRDIGPYLSPRSFNRFSLISKNMYLLDLYKDNYLYFETLRKIWPNEQYNPKSDYIYRYKNILNFASKYSDKLTSIADVNELLFYVKTKDELNYLISLGADINYEGQHTEVTVLIFTVQANIQKSDLIRALLENGADVTRRDMFDRSAYYLALENNYMDIVDIFGEYKYNILNDLYYHDIISPEFSNITNTNLELLLNKLKDIQYYHPVNKQLVIEIVQSSMESI